MPVKPKSPCKKAGCTKIVTTTYCEEHTTRRSRDRLYSHSRKDKKEQAFYSTAAWKRLRKLKLNSHPLCEHCDKNKETKTAQLVDHITPIKDDWGLRLTTSNLQSLCHRCHNVKTARE